MRAASRSSTCRSCSPRPPGSTRVQHSSTVRLSVSRVIGENAGRTQGTRRTDIQAGLGGRPSRGGSGNPTFELPWTRRPPGGTAICPSLQGARQLRQTIAFARHLTSVAWSAMGGGARLRGLSAGRPSNGVDHPDSYFRALGGESGDDCHRKSVSPQEDLRSGSGGIEAPTGDCGVVVLSRSRRFLGRR